jgi:hypothetical protein
MRQAQALQPVLLLPTKYTQIGTKLAIYGPEPEYFRCPSNQKYSLMGISIIQSRQNLYLNFNQML